MSFDESGVGEFPQYLFCELIIVAEFPRAAEISETLRYMDVGATLEGFGV